MRRRWESNGNSRRRGFSSCRLFGESLWATAASSRAVSVGSPIARTGPWLRSKWALEQRQAPSSRVARWLSPGAGSQVASTAIRLQVSVPVLSLQITLTEPRVSTADRRRTKAFWRAIRCTLRARARVTVGNSPSGTLATMIPTAKIKLSSGPTPTNSRLRPKVSTPISTAMAVIVRTIWPTCISRVLALRSVAAVRWATWPNSVSPPVA